MPTTDTDLTQLVINVGTKAQIEAGISGGTITGDMLSITTDGANYLTTDDVKSTYSSTGTEPVNGTAVASALSTLSIPTETTISNWGFTKNTGTVTSVNNTSPDGNGNVSLTIPSTASEVGALPDTTKYGADLSLTSGNLQLLDQDGNAFGNSVTVPDASNFANKDLSNLTSTGKNIGNWSSNVTNCITYIPQDIKLELNSGTLTLKAGSNCYLKTDTTTPSVSVGSDLTTTQSTYGEYFAIYNGSSLTTVLTSAYNYSTLPNTYSLPLAVVTVSSGIISSIDKVFNGFGYIGSTVFALPGVKGLIPNGRNADGTLNSTEYTVESVLTSTMTTSDPTARDYCITSSGIQRNRRYYLGEDGYLYRGSDGAKESGFVFAYSYITSSGIEHFTKKEVLQSIDWNDKNLISGIGMQSNKAIDLTLGATGTSYTAPANGYFVLGKKSSASNQQLAIQSGLYRGSVFSVAANNSLAVTAPAKKGDTVYFYYSVAGATDYFRFVFAEGEI